MSWREVFQRSEDLLTSVFFSRIRFLSPQSTEHVMALLVGGEAAELGEFQRIEFWPHLGGVNGRSWVEPDALLYFAKALVMVEVKPPFGGTQYLEQWQNQIMALAQDDDAPQRVHFVGLGGNTLNLDDSTKPLLPIVDAFTLKLHQAEWQDITYALQDLRIHATPSDLAVFDDWQEAFNLFGMSPPPAFQWPRLLEWANGCGLSTAAIPWPVWSMR